MKIAIVGAAGRMGKKLIELSSSEGLEVVSKVDVAEGYDKEWSVEVEGVIDFSFHTCVPGYIEKAAKAGIPYVIGTTGLTPDEQAKVDAATKLIPVVQSGNYSLGVNLMLNLVEQAAKTLNNGYEIEITEMHHKWKKDAPSGTAIMLAKAAGSTLPIHSLRGGSVVGDHTVMFAGELERLEITHRAQDRAAFAAGALKALKWAAGKPSGIYTMRDVLGFK